jgi:hypothetical protein
MSCVHLLMFTLLAATLIPHSIAANAGKLRQNKPSIVLADSALKSSMNIRLCNAYTDKAPLGVVLKNDHYRKEVDITKHEPLHYKSCMIRSMDLTRGDSLEFQQGGAQLGAFQVTSVPGWDAILLLVIHRKGSSSAPAFASHVFSKTQNAQVAVLDMYSGTSKNSVVIQETKQPSPDGDYVKGPKAHHLSVLSEKLAYDSVVSVDRGNYVCALTGTNNAKTAALKSRRLEFKAVDGESYLAMRVGNSKNPEFPEELVFFPSSCSHRTGITMLAVMLLLSLLQ